MFWSTSVTYPDGKPGLNHDPFGLRVSVPHRVVGNGGVVGQQELDTRVDRPLLSIGAPVDRDRGECQHLLDGAPRTGEAFVGGAGEAGAGRSRRVPAIDLLTEDGPRRPVDGGPHRRVVEMPEPDQSTHQVAVEAVDRRRRRWVAFEVRSGRPESADRRRTPGEHVVACPLDPLIGGIGTELIEEDQVPHGAAVLRCVPRPGLHPPAVLVLGGEDPGDRIDLHGARPGLADLGIVGTATEQMLQRRRPHRRIGRFQQPRQRVLGEDVGPRRDHVVTIRPAGHAIQGPLTPGPDGAAWGKTGRSALPSAARTWSDRCLGLAGEAEPRAPSTSSKRTRSNRGGRGRRRDDHRRRTPGRLAHTGIDIVTTGRSPMSPVRSETPGLTRSGEADLERRAAGRSSLP